MRFPNAAKGVKRIFTAEILGLIAGIAMVIAYIFGIVAVAAAFNANDQSAAMGSFASFGVMGILLIVALVLMIISFIMNIVGITNASKDEKSFSTALLFLVIGLAASVIGSFLQNVNPTIYGLCTSLSQLMNLFVNIFVISGIIRLADQLNRGDISQKGANIFKLLIAIYIIMLIVSLIATFMGGLTASIVAGVLMLVSAILSVVKYFLYLSFLSKAKKMLAEA